MEAIILNSIPQAVCVVQKNGKLSFVNKSFDRDVIPESVALGMSFLDDIVHQDLKESTMAILDGFESNGSSNVSLEMGSLKTLCLVGAERFPIYKTFQWTISALVQDLLKQSANILAGTSEKPDMPCYVLTGTPVVDKERRVCEQYGNEEFIDFFQNAPIALHWLSGTGHVLWANNTELQSLGYTASGDFKPDCNAFQIFTSSQIVVNFPFEFSGNQSLLCVRSPWPGLIEYIGHHIMEFCPDEGEHLSKVFADLQSGKTVRNESFVFRTKDGATRHLLVDSNVRFNEDKSFGHTRCFIRDHTDRVVKQALEAFERQERENARRAKDVFLRRFFHEVKSPLHCVAGGLVQMATSIESAATATSTTAEGDVDGSKPRDNRSANESKRSGSGNGSGALVISLHDVRELSHQIQGLRSMADNVAFMVQNDAAEAEAEAAPGTAPSHMRLSPRALHVGTLVDEVIDVVKCVEVRSGQSVAFKVEGVSEVPLHLQADVLVKQALYNLMQNAVRFSPQQGRVSLSLSFEGDGSEGGADGDSSASMGRFTFTITNNTEEMMDVDNVKLRMSSTYHHTQRGQSSSLSCNNPIPTPVSAQGSGHSSQLRLTSSRGLGIGLYITNQIVTHLGGQLSYSSAVNEAVFSFSIFTPCGPTIASLQRPRAAEMEEHKETATRPPSDVTAPIPASTCIATPTATDASAIPVLAGTAMPVIADVPAAVAAPLFSSTVVNAQVVEPGQAPKTLRVLVVDDVAMCQKIVVNALKMRGFQTEVASDGKEACDKIGAEPRRFDAVLMDLRMPIMDGIEATRYCREIIGVRDLPIIGLSAETGGDVQDKAIEAGMNAYISKPAEAAEMVQLLNTFCMM